MLRFLQELAKMQKPGANLKQGLLNTIRAAAEQAKLKILDYPDGFRIENSGKAAVVVQFGGRREFYETIETLEKEQTDYRVIVTSSNVKSMRIGEIKWILNNKYQTKNKWLIIDIEHKESPKTVNFMLYGGERKRGEHEAGSPGLETETPANVYAGEDGYASHPVQKEKPRRKKIYGKRGEHKEQD